MGRKAHTLTKHTIFFIGPRRPYFSVDPLYVQCMQLYRIGYSSDSCKTKWLEGVRVNVYMYVHTIYAYIYICIYIATVYAYACTVFISAGAKGAEAWVSDVAL